MDRMRVGKNEVGSAVASGFVGDQRTVAWDRLAEEADELARRLFPICRSITGDGVRQTLSILREVSEFEVREIPSGTVCYDWTVPNEWNIADGWVKDSSGNRVIDFQENNLHVMSYSVPIDRTMSFQELESHLHTLPALPRAIPYRTSYYQDNWGFCLSHEQFSRMDRYEQYHVRIDSTLEPGSLTLGEFLLEGSSGQEFLLSTYCCHPSMGNDNLSGAVLWTLLLREMKSMELRHSYRFVIAPETIGAIAYLSENQEAMKSVVGGFVITTVAGPGKFGYKHTFAGDHLIDRVVRQTFDELSLPYVSYPFDLRGSDERQYSVPYFRIPVGTISKDKYQEYDYYHTSLDNLDFISGRALVETLKLYLSAMQKLEMDVIYRSLNPYCEPMLSKRGLYPQISGHIRQMAVQLNTGGPAPRDPAHEGTTVSEQEREAILEVMFLSDGNTPLLDIASKMGKPVKLLYEMAELLCKLKLLERT